MTKFHMKHELGEENFLICLHFPTHNTIQRQSWFCSGRAFPKVGTFSWKYGLGGSPRLPLSVCMMNRRKRSWKVISRFNTEKFIAQKLAFGEKIIKSTLFQRMDSQLFSVATTRRTKRTFIKVVSLRRLLISFLGRRWANLELLNANDVEIKH